MGQRQSRSPGGGREAPCRGALLLPVASPGLRLSCFPSGGWGARGKGVQGARVGAGLRGTPHSSAGVRLGKDPQASGWAGAMPLGRCWATASGWTRQGPRPTCTRQAGRPGQPSTIPAGRRGEWPQVWETLLLFRRGVSVRRGWNQARELSSRQPASAARSPVGGPPSLESWLRGCWPQS